MQWLWLAGKIWAWLKKSVSKNEAVKTFLNKKCATKLSYIIEKESELSGWLDIKNQLWKSDIGTLCEITKMHVMTHCSNKKNP